VISVFLQTNGPWIQRHSNRPDPHTRDHRHPAVITIVGMILLLFLVSATSSVLTFIPGLLLMGAGTGIMLTSSVNVVQSSFPEQDQGEISGLSRSVSNLGSSLGTAIVGSVLVTSLVPENQTYGLALITVVVIAGIGLIAALLLPPFLFNLGQPHKLID